MTNLTRTERLLNALATGSTLTAKQIAARFNLASPSSAIRHLRNDGADIYVVSIREPFLSDGYPVDMKLD